MDGKTGSFDSSGYILDGWNGITVPGWRVSNSHVAHFEFARGDKSYASGKGKGIHNGVIGCAFFYEKEYVPSITITNLPDAFPKWPKDNPWWPTWTVTSTGTTYLGKAGDSITPTGSAFNMQASSNSNMAQCSDKSFNSSSSINQVMSSSLGTGFGDKTEHKVVAVGFERDSSSPAEVLTVYYDTRSGLKNRGIDVEGYTEIASPFPGSQAEYNKFCQPPDDWND
jgi:hypothetical protein